MLEQAKQWRKGATKLFAVNEAFCGLIIGVLLTVSDSVVVVIGTLCVSLYALLIAFVWQTFWHYNDDELIEAYKQDPRNKS